jgi:hypothetical protein
MIYQWNETSYAFVRKYGALYEIQRDMGFPMQDVITAMKEKRPIGGYFFTRTPMIDLDAPQKAAKAKNSVKVSLMLSEGMADEFVALVGQRNKQDIIRDIIGQWIKNEKKK